ncbi:MAG: hypothetical protein H6741_09230 [Alphaproteobacteria bacterium]|nr:hypothetical protein [Alphaproteobacteria bacterium]MCB9792896.1 hypothetical protein [Alphaproteobacteria bacterium]
MSLALLLALAWEPSAAPLATLDGLGPEGEALVGEQTSSEVELGVEGAAAGLAWSARVSVHVEGEARLGVEVSSPGARRPVRAEVAGPADAPLSLDVSLPLTRKARRQTGLDALRWTWTLTPELRLEPPPFDPAPPEAWPTRSYALVWDDATLRVNPRDPASAEQLRALPEGRVDPAAQVSPYRVVAHWTAAMVELETTPGARAPHCHDGAAPSRDYPFQLFAPRQDLQPLTARVVTQEHADGSGFTFAAGLALIPEGGGHYRPAIPGLALSIELPEDAVDLRYQPSGHFEVPEAGGWLHPDADGVLGWLDGAPVRGPVTPIVGREGVDELLVTLRTPCAELRLRTDAARVLPAP